MSPAQIPALREIEVIAPNFKRRHSGVTSTVIRLVPLQARDIAIVASGPDLPGEVPNLPPRGLLRLPRSGPSGARVWHARRNVEMVAGLALKYLAGKRLKLLFTSAAQRRHTGFTRWLIRQMDAVIATSAKSAGYLERDATVIHHGIDTVLFSPVENREALRATLDLPVDGPLVGCFGRIRHQKGNDLFIKAMISIFSEVPHGRALMMGRATEEHKTYLQELKDEVAAAGLSDRILFRDEVPIDQLSLHFQALDLYIAPQRWEGFGLTPLEAMACGAPVVATRVGAFEELIEDGVTGNLVEVDDVDAITANLRRLLVDEEMRASFATAARENVVKNFSIEKEAASILHIYHGLLGRA
ncbi:glycosyltransferase family 1 protein [Roseobacter denitrificans]|uniref:Lipopolysaccharide core biosynthesis mannosyltransferase n=1 Tax=Roseobacter denitrificans (strain ATCC 33942 / OCh 114) TaxID=375451 RepID=Q163N3_ROSDO|nr:glycosyltransferase family 4 protein [Roseobacter denitrificans]ABG32810.1 lipopolysaccharide core biosynthesis mannosyltransferase [Roseobacter denitrificans OCh 114]AVL52213.1 glycosyltransferase family 1 protein [Roseobacter denitrificans]SFF95213.1 mannosyltransferase [Roseobacter denitrificans OCh 114]